MQLHIGESRGHHRWIPASRQVARLAMTRKGLAQPAAVIPRESEGSSTPRLIHVIADVPGILGRPLSRTTTAEVVTLSVRLAMTRKDFAQPTAVIPRESGGSSTPRLIHVIADVSGILSSGSPRARPGGGRRQLRL